MSEQHPEPEPVPEAVPEPVPEAVPEPALQPAPEGPSWPAPAPVPAPSARSRERRDLMVAGALVVVAALVGGGYLIFGKGGDDKPAARASAGPAPTATTRKAYGVTAGGSHYGDLGELLLPIPEGMLQGPDYQQYGSDTVLDASKAKAMAEGGDSSSELSAKERKQADAALDAMHIKGAALRTYRNNSGDQLFRITIVQVGNKLAAGAAPETFRKLSAGSDVFRKGPAVPRHPHAVCVLPGNTTTEEQDDDGLDWLGGMYCQATEGDLMVEFESVGPTPLDKGQATMLMAEQLDRIQAPGEGV